ncbi:MAG: hypothetical protein AAFY84_16440 [Pseudomonadota bacterium]
MKAACEGRRLFSCIGVNLIIECGMGWIDAPDYTPQNPPSWWWFTVGIVVIAVPAILLIALVS